MLELEYIQATKQYNISGLKYSVEEAKNIAFFIETMEQDKHYTQQDVDRDDAQQEINYKRGQ
tara:strand:- start:852 stop:1037 length:186 start_codon:yes stop_codon:yes gene_type:complete